MCCPFGRSNSGYCSEVPTHFYLEHLRLEHDVHPLSKRLRILTETIAGRAMDRTNPQLKAIRVLFKTKIKESEQGSYPVDIYIVKEEGYKPENC